MDNLQRISRDEALAAIADSPCMLEFRSVALERDAMIVRSGGGLLLVDRSHTLAGAVGTVNPRDLDGLYQIAGRPRELLADRAAYEVLKGALRFARAKIATLDGPWRPPIAKPRELEIRPLRASDSLDHLPLDLIEELQPQADHVIYAAFEGGLAVSFAYSATMTETLADISIDTLEGYRRRGIARAVVSRLIDEVIRLGKAPVWGANDDNVPSLALAATLGFTRDAGELFVHEGGATY
jgi:GNAT superfamily N-acetyltransferase